MRVVVNCGEGSGTWSMVGSQAVVGLRVLDSGVGGRWQQLWHSCMQQAGGYLGSSAKRGDGCSGGG